LRCFFCQNYQISREGLGKIMAFDELLKRTVDMIRTENVHNVNFVTPDHFFPYTFRLVGLLREQGETLPIVYNLSGYQSVAMLKRARDYADIYLPDFKYADPALAQELSKCRNYPDVALNAISEMVRQKGFLKIPNNRSGLARRGVLVRHLILPGAIENSINALTTLFTEFGPKLPLSIMSQYQPVREQSIPGLNRTLTGGEFERVYSHAMDLGFEHLFVQFPEKDPSAHTQTSPFIPDFQREKPFAA